MKWKVTVFGSARPVPGENSYQEALTLGRLLGENGFDVLTGGYQGTMEAVSQGAAEAGAHVIGVTCEELEIWRNAQANPWVAEEWLIPSIQNRMMNLMDNCDAAIALPGGVGTLAEITLLWNRMIIDSVKPYPFILIGEGWKRIFDTVFDLQGQYIPLPDRDCLLFVQDVEESIALLKKMLG